jgi:hypothetical protein
MMNVRAAFAAGTRQTDLLLYDFYLTPPGT